MGLGYTGRLAEGEMFGRVNRESIPSKENYLPYKEAMRLAKEAQPYEDPSDPDPRFAQDLHATISENLGLDDYSDLSLYTAVDSSLDTYHGVDAFFELDWNGKIYRVTMDVTINYNKGENGKAEVVFMFPPEGLDPKEDKEEYHELLNRVGEKVADIFKDKMLK